LAALNANGNLALTGNATQLTFGNYAASPYGSWLQTRHVSVDGNAYPLVLNPLGGNVGIGTASPFCMFHSASTSTAGNPATSGTTDAAVTQRFDALNVGTALDFGTNGSGVVWMQNRAKASFVTNYPIALNPNGGNVGIGKSPSYPLDVAGDCNLSAGSVYRINGVPISSSGIANQITNPGTSLGGVYQNTTGKPVFHTVTVSMNSTSTPLIAYTDSSSSPTTVVASITNQSSTYSNMCLSFWVLPGNYYKVALGVAGGTLQYWTQWY
jgi:hypothetical protein